MNRKTEDFFDGSKPSMSKIMSQISQHPDHMDKIIQYVIEKVEHFTEFETKKEHLEEKYQHKLNELYAEYMKE